MLQISRSMYLTFFSVFLFVAFLNLFLFPTDHDEVSHLHISWHLAQGNVPYVDFFDHHHHLFHYLLTPLFFFGGDTLLTVQMAEYFSFVVFVLFVSLSFLLANRIYGKTVAVFSVLILICLPEIMIKSLQIRPDVLAVCFVLLAAYFHVFLLEKPGILCALLAGFALSLAFAASQKGIFFVAAAGIFHLYLLYRKELSFRYSTACFAGFAFPLLVALWLLHSLGALNHYKTMWLVKMNWGETFSLFASFTNVSSFNSLLRLSGWLGAGVLFIHGSFRTDYGESKNVLINLFAAAGVSLLFFVKVPYMHNFLYVAPFFSIIAGYSLYQLPIWRRGLFLSFMSLFVFVFLCFNLYSPFKPKQLEKRKKEKRERLIEYVVSVTEPEDFVYDGNFDFNIFRKDLDYLWYGLKDTIPAYVKTADYHYNVYDLIEKKKPKVISGAGIDPSDPRIAGAYELANHPDAAKSGYTIYMRKE